MKNENYYPPLMSILNGFEALMVKHGSFKPEKTDRYRPDSPILVS